MPDDIYYSIALTRMAGLNLQTALHLYQTVGSAQAVYEHRNNIGDIVPDSTPRLREAMKDWDEALHRAAVEMEFITKHHIQALTPNDEHYPQRLMECQDAPLVLYYMGTANLNQRHVISIVGTRHATVYGQDLTRRFISELRQRCPQVLIVSGLAYGIDVCAHRNALEQQMETVGVLAHGLDELYPRSHRDTAKQMVGQGGLLSEYMTQTHVDKRNFVQRNRIVAGMSDATIVVESAAKGGSLITANIAQSYDRDVFAFPGAVGATASEGCNKIIRDHKAQLITSAADFIEAMGWEDARAADDDSRASRELSLFPELSTEEQTIVTALQNINDQQINTLAVQTNIPVAQLIGLLFNLEMKGVVRTMAGGMYHLLA